MNNKPLVSVVMPAYNAKENIHEAIKSILDQTYSNIELIVIDDGSTDDTSKIISTIYDQRVKYYKNSYNRGLVYTLNRGIKLSNGKYIARMDSDDISLPNRIYKQVEYLEEHKDCIICGTYAQTFRTDSLGAKKYLSKLTYEINDKEIKKSLVYDCCFAHPTVMFRSSVFIESNVYYEDEWKNGDDYKLWIDLMSYGMYHNIPEVLLQYRISGTQMSSSINVTTISANKCRWYYIEKYTSFNIYQFLLKGTFNIDTIRFLKKNKCDNQFLLRLIYLSLSNYNLYVIYYYFISRDILRFPMKTLFQILKRTFLGPNPILLA